jgi:protein-tyrosine phosphatase
MGYAEAGGTPAQERRERRLPLQGAVNFRDLGGYRARDGRHVRWGRIFRSDSLAELSDADVDVVAALGLRAICDLRADSERTH